MVQKKTTSKKQKEEPKKMEGMAIVVDGKTHFNMERLKALLSKDRQICSIITDDNQTILCEIWFIDGEYSIFPFAKLLTEDEKAELKMDGQKPEF